MKLVGPYSFQQGIVRAPDKTITFTGAANFGAAGTAVTVYTITGRVRVIEGPVPFCTSSLGEAAPTATVSLGTSDYLGLFCGATNSVNIDINEFWSDTNPTRGNSFDLLAGQPVMLSSDIIINCLAQNTNAGTLVFQGLHYIPLTAGASLS